MKAKAKAKSPRAVGYIRVSSEDQAREGVSLDAQRARIEAWCLANQRTLAGADVFVDAGISGKRWDNRPGLRAALDAVCECGGTLVVYSLSRMARSIKDTITISERLTKAGADLVSLSEALDTTTATGEMMFHMLAVLAEFERKLISERTRLAAAHKRSRSERWGYVPLGRRLLKDGRTLADDEAEQRTLREVHRLRAEGKSLREVAAALDAAGHRPKRGGAGWQASTVRYLLQATA
jgi:DNA invertase Pin-like site-specific DNA recombinase